MDRSTQDALAGVSMGRHPGVEELASYFAYGHLPTELQAVSQPFAKLAVSLLVALPVDGPELTAGLRKLLEAKDCAVRHALKLARAKAEADAEQLQKVQVKSAMINSPVKARDEGLLRPDPADVEATTIEKLADGGMVLTHGVDDGSEVGPEFDEREPLVPPKGRPIRDEPQA